MLDERLASVCRVPEAIETTRKTWTKRKAK